MYSNLNQTARLTHNVMIPLEVDDDDEATLHHFYNDMSSAKNRTLGRKIMDSIAHILLYFYFGFVTCFFG